MIPRRLWDLEHGTELRTIDAGPIEAWTVSLFADGHAVASGSQGGNVNLWSVASGEKQARVTCLIRKPVVGRERREAGASSRSVSGMITENAHSPNR